MFSTCRKIFEFLKSICFKHEFPQPEYDHLGHAETPLIDLSRMVTAGGIVERRHVAMYGLLVNALGIGFNDVRMKDICSERLEQCGELAVGVWNDVLFGISTMTALID